MCGELAGVDNSEGMSSGGGGGGGGGHMFVGTETTLFNVLQLVKSIIYQTNKINLS